MLIVALGILTLLSVLALTFVSIMKLERIASTNYVDGVKARLIAEGGLDSAAAQLKVFAQGESFSDPAAPFIYAEGNYWLPIEEATAIRRGDSGDTPALNQRRASFAGTLMASYNKGADQYKVKVIDTQSQFNLNSRYEIQGAVDQVYVRFLDALGVAISQLNPRARTGTGPGRNPIATARYPKGSPTAYRGGEAIYRFRQAREGQRFNSKSELMEVLFHEDDFNLLQDYVTTRSWFDPTTVTAVPMDGLNNKPWSDVSVKELRSPININLASTEVIAANLAGIAGRFIYLYTGDYDARPSRLQDIDVGTLYASTASKEETAYGTTGILVYLNPFGYQRAAQPNDPPIVHGAIKFAQIIKAHVMKRCSSTSDPGGHPTINCPVNGPFKTFSEWEDFVDRVLTDSFLQSERDTTQSTGQFVYPGHDRGPADPLLLQLDEKALTTPSAVEVKNSKDFPARFYDAVRSMIKANFNPNPRLSGWNPDEPVFLRCDKGSLLYPVDLTAPASTKAQRQTNEWCLASKGVFEITSLGEVLGEVPEVAAQGTERIIYAQAKVQGVVQLYDTLTHTTQRDFERKGAVYGSQDKRDVMESYPIPKVYWDPRAEQLPPAKVQEYLDDARGKDVTASDYDGHLQLAPKEQVAIGPTADDVQIGTHVIPMGGRRFELLLQDRHIEDPASSQTNNKDVLIADTSGGVRNNESMGTAPSTGLPKNGYGYPFGSARQGVAPATRDGLPQRAWRWDPVTPDGYLNSELRQTLLWYRASDENSQTMIANPDGRLRGKSAATGIGNVQPTLKGGLEFWYKPDFDWTMPGTTFADQRYCGLLATSHITQNETGFQGGSTPALGSWTRGTQMYITRNTSGELRITRMYFECVGPTGHPQEEPRLQDPKAGAGTLISFTEYLNRATTDQDYVWPPTELLIIPQPYHSIKFARTDHWIPYQTLRDWKANEWHHIAAYWDDQAGEVWLWLDGEGYTVAKGNLVARVWPSAAGSTRPANGRYIPFVRHPNGPPNPPVPANDPVVVPPGPAENPSFVRLNHLTGPTTSPTGVTQPAYEDSLWPKDQITIGAVKRDQAVVGGLFKHDKDAVLPANGTIDDVRFYDALTPPGTSNNPRPGTASRYDPGTDVGYWTNEFDLSRAFQNGVSEITLAGVHYTAYLPDRYGAQTFSNGTGAVRVEFEVQRADGSVVKPAHWASAFSQVRGQPAEIKLTDPAGPTGVPVRVGRNDKLVYKILMSPGSTTGGNAFASPVLDDISLVYYLPNPQVLLKERVIN